MLFPGEETIRPAENYLIFLGAKPLVIWFAPLEMVATNETQFPTAVIANLEPRAFLGLLRLEYFFLFESACVEKRHI